MKRRVPAYVSAVCCLSLLLSAGAAAAAQSEKREQIGHARTFLEDVDGDPDN